MLGVKDRLYLAYASITLCILFSLCAHCRKESSVPVEEPVVPAKEPEKCNAESTVESTIEPAVVEAVPVLAVKASNLPEHVVVLPDTADSRQYLMTFPMNEALVSVGVCRMRRSSVSV